MAKIQDKDTRYFIEINLQSLQVTRCGFENKWNINKGRQTDSEKHRLFLQGSTENLLLDVPRNLMKSLIHRLHAY